MENLLIWDLETSGLGGDAKILEIGAISVIGGRRQRHRWLLKHPHLKVPEHITKINGITNEMIDAEGISPSVALGEFKALLKRVDKHITHNGIHFDIPFLVAEMGEVLHSNGQTLDFLKRWLMATAYDTAVEVKAKKLGRQQGSIPYLRFAREVMEVRKLGLKYNLEIAVKEAGIEYRDAHSALGDVQMTYELYLSQIGAQTGAKKPSLMLGR